MNSLTVKSPAKINLFLRVLGRREDGYHELITRFHRISLCDKLILTRASRPGFRLICDHPKLQEQKENLIFCAWELLKKAANVSGGVHVKLEKNIPIAAGLGGGSSNAAHFLIGANRLFRLELPLVTLLRLAEQIGSDVPFFIYNVREALGFGRGEIIKPAKNSRTCWFVLVFPPFELSTRDVYERLHAPKLTAKNDAVKITRQFLKLGVNDLFPASAAIRPELTRLLSLIRSLGAQHVFMSGSGPTIVSLHSQKGEAECLLRSIRKAKLGLSALICKSY